MADIQDVFDMIFSNKEFVSRDEMVKLLKFICESNDRLCPGNLFGVNHYACKNQPSCYECAFLNDSENLAEWLIDHRSEIHEFVNE